jgi:hypothetical protein
MTYALDSMLFITFPVVEEFADLMVQFRHKYFQRGTPLIFYDEHSPGDQQHSGKNVLPGIKRPSAGNAEFLIAERPQITDSPEFARSEQVHGQMQLGQGKTQAQHLCFMHGKATEYSCRQYGEKEIMSQQVMKFPVHFLTENDSRSIEIRQDSRQCAKQSFAPVQLKEIADTPSGKEMSL